MLTLNIFCYSAQKLKKKPPPRPPPPDLSNIKSKSAWQLNQNGENICLIDWSPPNSPKTNRPSGGSLYSSFSSSTSSIASSKRSSEYESLPFTSNVLQNDQTGKSSNMPVFNLTWSAKIQQQVASKQNEKLSNTPQILMPTIIRPQVKTNVKLKTGGRIEKSGNNGDVSPPMPIEPPPSPPKEVIYNTVPCAVAIHKFQATQSEDLPLEANDIIYLIRRINDEWLYGRVDDREGMFPENFVEVKVPLQEDENIVIALYEFCPEMAEDLPLTPGQKVKVLKIISDNWMFGESNGITGQFPSNYVNHIPKI